MITTADLKTQTRRDLADLAKQYGISGWHSMRKAELISELTRIQRRARRQASSASSSRKNGTSKNGKPRSNTAKAGSGKNGSASSRTTRLTAPAPPGDSKRRAARAEKKGAAARGSSSKTKTNRAPASVTAGKSKAKPTKPQANPVVRATLSRAARLLRQRQKQADRYKDLSSTSTINGRKSSVSESSEQRDRVVLLVRDSFWLHATWEVSRSAVERAKAAMAEHWHTARPTLRILRVSNGAAANATEQLVRDIPVHGGVNNWYIDVADPPSRFRVVIGYMSADDRMFAIAKSNIVETPAPGSCDSVDGHWEEIAEDYERIYSMSGGNGTEASRDLKQLFEERLSRSMRGSEGMAYGSAADIALRRSRDLPFDVDAELIIYGNTVPGSTVTLAGEPVKLRPDGSFTVRMELPDRRQVLPVVAHSRDGMRQRTTVVAVERNTKVMEPVDNEPED